jgi:hypothetical protein
MAVGRRMVFLIVSRSKVKSAIVDLVRRSGKPENSTDLMSFAWKMLASSSFMNELTRLEAHETGKCNCVY